MAKEIPEQAPHAPAAAQNDIWVMSSDGDLAQGFTLPPGGVSEEPSDAPKPGRRCRVPRPDYITPTGRDLRLDLIRGLMVFVMIVDHLGVDSPLFLLTGGGRFLTSAAEGFVLISGLMTGLVYWRIVFRDGMSFALHKLLGRAATLYVVTVTATLLFVAFSEVAALPWARHLDLSNPVAFVVSVFTLHQTYYLVDVLLLYTIFTPCALAAFVMFDHGRGWLVVAGSALIYALSQYMPNLVTLPWPIEGKFYNLAAWQVLFFASLWLGYNQSRIPTLGYRATRRGLLGTGAAMAAIIGIFALFRFEGGLVFDDLIPNFTALQSARLWAEQHLFLKSDLQFGRLITSAIVFGFFFFLTTRFWPQIRRVTGPVLLPFGRHALYAFTALIAMVGLFGLARTTLDPAIANARWLDTVVMIAGAALIWLLVKLRILMPTPATRHYWLAAPIAAGIGVAILLTAQVAEVNAAIARMRADYGRIAQLIVAGQRPGDRVWFDGPNYVDAYAAVDPDPARVFAVPSLPAADADVDDVLAPASAGASRIHVLFYGERAADPEGRYERWLAEHAFKAREEWVGDIRWATYAVHRASVLVPAGAAWRGGITLSAASVDLSDVGAGDIIPLALTWTAPDAPSADLDVFIHLGPADGAPVAQNDNAPVAGFRPTASWGPGETITDQRGVYITPTAPPGRYTLFVGLYDSATGERLKLVSGEDRFALGHVTLR
ncbi:MAG: OpgC domain-containing protein [Thermoflexales bacterium]